MTDVEETMLKEATDAAKIWLTSVKVLGPVTVAFFALLAFLMWTQVTQSQDATKERQEIKNQLNRMEQSMNNAISDNTHISALTVYFLREICKQGAKSELQVQACNPPPVLLTTPSQ